jgi:16S rRNA (guanine966-N2)-methyltransferase
MRIISGKYGKRIFKAPRGNRTHPMSEKARGALFNTLGDISGFRVLDSYAGSGALAFEALSRGAQSAQCVDNSKHAHKSMKETAELLGIESEIKITHANISTWSDNNVDELFNIVFVDPPYHSVRDDIIEKLTRHVETGGWLIVSYPTSEPTPRLSLPFNERKYYGDATILFYHRPR